MRRAPDLAYDHGEDGTKPSRVRWPEVVEDADDGVQRSLAPKTAEVHWDFKSTHSFIPDDDLSAVDARKLMNEDEEPDQDASDLYQPSKTESPRQDQGIAHAHFDNVSAKVLESTIYRVINSQDSQKKKKKLDELHKRHMVHSHHLHTIHIVLHEGEERVHFLMDLPASINFSQLRCAVAMRLASHFNAGPELAQSLSLKWLHDGEAIELNYEIWLRYVFEMWCAQPWEIHVHHTSGNAPGTEDYRWVRHIAKLLFTRYDVNRNGRIERRELLRVINDLHLERFNCSEELIARFVEAEFERLDVDKSQGLDLDEFTNYVKRMSVWMRDQLLLSTNEAEIFALLAGRAMEARLPPTVLPEFVDLGDGRGLIARIETGCFGIKLEIPKDVLGRAHFAPGCFKAGSKVAAQTLFRGSVSYLSEGVHQLFPDDDPKSKQSWLPYSPIVRVDYPAFEDGEEPPELGAPSPPPFLTPITLVMPHCFDGRSCEASLAAMCGAPHGALQWKAINALNDETDLGMHAVQIDQDEMRISIPHSGIFCAFSRSKDMGLEADTCAARFHVFAMAEVPRKKPSGLRVHLCPEIPNQTQEMEFFESSNWGLATCTGASQLLYLVKGVRFKVQYLDQVEEFVWSGMRVSKAFTVPITGFGGRDALPDDPDRRAILDGNLTISMLPGIGRRASNVRACAKRAGMPEADYKVRFATRLKGEVRPKPPTLSLLERTPYDFTVTWQQPELVDSTGDGKLNEITHYEIQLATTAPNGNYYPWKELWCGAGHEPPNFRMQVAQRIGDMEMIEKLKKENESSRMELKLERQDSPTKKLERQNSSTKKKERQNSSTKSPRKSGSNKKTSEGTSPQKKRAEEEPLFHSMEQRQTFSYKLEVDPHLFGRLRIRCWSEGEERPSIYSPAIQLPRWNGRAEQKDIFQVMLETESVRNHSALL